MLSKPSWTALTKSLSCRSSSKSTKFLPSGWRSGIAVGGVARLPVGTAGTGSAANPTCCAELQPRTLAIEQLLVEIEGPFTRPAAKTPARQRCGNELLERRRRSACGRRPDTAGRRRREPTRSSRSPSQAMVSRRDALASPLAAADTRRPRNRPRPSRSPRTRKRPAPRESAACSRRCPVWSRLASARRSTTAATLMPRAADRARPVAVGVGGQHHGGVHGLDRVAVDQALRRRCQHDARQIVVAEHRRLLEDAGRDDHGACPHLGHAPCVDQRNPVVGVVAGGIGAGADLQGRQCARLLAQYRELADASSAPPRA